MRSPRTRELDSKEAYRPRRPRRLQPDARPRRSVPGGGAEEYRSRLKRLTGATTAGPHWWEPGPAALTYACPCRSNA